MVQNNSKKDELQHINYNSYDELYKSITKEGSLGLLALGAHGLLLWRKKREEIERIEKTNRNEKNNG